MQLDPFNSSRFPPSLAKHVDYTHLFILFNTIITTKHPRPSLSLSLSLSLSVLPAHFLRLWDVEALIDDHLRIRATGDGEQRKVAEAKGDHGNGHAVHEI